MSSLDHVWGERPETGGPAFPVEVKPHPHTLGAQAVTCPGMTLRDYFAAKAMQSLILDQSSLNGRGWDHISAGAYQMADAMLAAREAA